MATRSTKGSDSGDKAGASLADEEFDSEYEDDLLELVERLARRRSRSGRKPPQPEADAETGTDAETKAGTDTEADAETGADDAPRDAVADSPKPETKSKPKAAVTTEADAADATAGSGSEEPAAGASQARRIRVLTIVSAVLATALAAVSTFAFLQWREYGGGSSPQVVRQKVAQRAGEIVNVLFTYDYHDAKGYLEKQSAVMTKSAAATVKPNWPTLTTLLETGKYVSTAQIEQVYVGDVSADKASVIVIVNNKLVTSKGIQNSVGATLQFGLAKENGVWLANAVPKLESSGVQTSTDLQGKPLQAAPTPTPTPVK